MSTWTEDVSGLQNPRAGKHITVSQLIERLKKLPMNSVVMIPEPMPNTHGVNMTEVEEDSFVYGSGVTDVVYLNG